MKHWSFIHVNWFISKLERTMLLWFICMISSMASNRIWAMNLRFLRVSFIVLLYWEWTMLVVLSFKFNVVFEIDHLVCIQVVEVNRHWVRFMVTKVNFSLCACFKVNFFCELNIFLCIFIEVDFFDHCHVVEVDRMNVSWAVGEWGSELWTMIRPVRSNLRSISFRLVISSK